MEVKGVRRGSVHKKGELSLTEILMDMRRNPEFRRAGCIGIFIGVVRGETLKGGRVEGLQIEAYEEKANEDLERICRELMGEKGVIDIRIHHILGKFGVGEDLVYVCVTAGHRRDLFRTLRKAVERYKEEAAIFKKEISSTGEGYWVSEKTNSHR